MNDDDERNVFAKKTKKVKALSEVTELLADFVLVADSEPTTDLEGTRVLVVDDDPMIRRAVKRFLLKRGVEITEAEGVKDALEQFVPNFFDIVLTDLHMPDGKGTEILKHISEQDPSVKGIMLSGEPTVDHTMEAVEYAVFRILRKPFENKKLEEVLQDALTERAKHKPKRTAEDRLAFENAVESLWLAKQPVVNQNRSPIGYELLTRSEETNLKDPRQLWSLAEDLGEIEKLGNAVRRLAKEELKLSPHHMFFLNVHVDEVRSDDLLLDPVLTANADRICLELNAMRSIEELVPLKSASQTLRAKGYHIAIDDLGVGSASLASLVALSPEFVKLDRVLVEDIATNQNKSALVRRLVQACDDLSIHVIAECVESLEEFVTLKALGIRLFQGFFLGRPT